MEGIGDNFGLVHATVYPEIFEEEIFTTQLL